MTRRLPLMLVLAGLISGFTHAALTAPDPAPQVRCFEDGSCSNGWCDPWQLCNEALLLD